jgi:hypothetical protein
VVRSAALVAGCGPSTRGKAATAVASSKASAGNRGSTATESRGASIRGRAGTHVVAELMTVVATAGGAGAANAKGRAVGLDVAQALAVIALLGFRGARQRAFAGFMIRLLAIVAESVRRGTSLGVVTKLTTFVACATRERRHIDDV